MNITILISNVFRLVIPNLYPYIDHYISHLSLIRIDVKHEKNFHTNIFFILSIIFIVFYWNFTTSHENLPFIYLATWSVYYHINFITQFVLIVIWVILLTYVFISQFSGVFPFTKILWYVINIQLFIYIYGNLKKWQISMNFHILDYEIKFSIMIDSLFVRFDIRS